MTVHILSLPIVMCAVKLYMALPGVDCHVKVSWTFVNTVPRMYVMQSSVVHCTSSNLVIMSIMYTSPCGAICTNSYGVGLSVL